MSCSPGARAYPLAAVRRCASACVSGSVMALLRALASVRGAGGSAALAGLEGLAFAAGEAVTLAGRGLGPGGGADDQGRVHLEGGGLAREAQSGTLIGVALELERRLTLLVHPLHTD